jgi:hypothetical protein
MMLFTLFGWNLLFHTNHMGYDPAPSPDSRLETVAPMVDFNMAPTAMSFTAANGPFEDLGYLFQTADFNYMDDEGDPFTYLTVTALPVAGVLYVDANNNETYDAGEEVSINDQVSKVDLDARNLQYVQFGAENTGFSFTVNDGNSDSDTYTATLNVLPIPTVTLSVNPANLAESQATYVELTATLSNVYALTVEVDLSFSGTATLNEDFVPFDHSIPITSDGSSTSSSTFLINLDDEIFEGNETVTIDIEKVTNGVEDGTQQATYTITDDDAPPTVTLTQSQTEITDESGGQVYVTAELSTVAGVAVEVPLSFSGSATGGGSDYSITASTITIPAGSTKDSIRITSIFDGIEEGTETIIVDMGSPTNATEDGVQQISFDIIDEDAVPEIHVEDADGTAIPDGDDSPSVAKGTDFGDVNTDGGSVSRTYTIKNTGFADVSLSGDPVVALSGSDAFTVIAAPAMTNISGPDGSTTFTVAFDPANTDCDAPLTTEVSIANNDADENPYNFTLQGTPVDNVDPIAACRDITIYLDATGNASITADDIDNTSTDACGIDSVAINMDVFDCSNIGLNTVVLTATDNNSNTDTCHATVTVQDTVSPIARCVPTLDVDLSGDGTETLTAEDVDDGSTDACGIADLNLNRTIFDLDDRAEQDLSVTLTVADNNGNESSCTTQIVILELPEPENPGSSTRETIRETELEENGEQPAIFDPCSCRDNTDSLSNGNFTNMGLFDDEIVVISATMGDTWAIQGTSDDKPLPFAYTANPEAQVADLTPISVGDTLNYVGSMIIEGNLRYIYSLPIIHRDSLGYSVEVAETTGKYPDFSLTVDNECFYPDIYFDDLATGFLQSSDPLTITGRILNGADATGAFILEGDTLAQGPLPLELTLDFSTMETGPTELIFVADADTAGMKDLSDPGCRQKVYEPFVISDGNFACNGQVNINLNNDCYIEPALVHLMRGRYVSSVSYLYDLTIAMDEEIIPDNRITRPGLYSYRIDGPDGFICWGMLRAEDKTPPVLESTDFAQDTLFCTDLEAILNNPNTVETSDPNYTGRPYFRDACSEEYADFTFTDRVEYGDCEDGYAAQLFRTFTAADAGGLQVSTTQVITFVTPSLDSLIRIDEPVEIQTCQAEGVTAAAVWPFWINSFGDTVRLNEVECGYGIAVDSTVFPICGNEGRKIERYIRVFDWCAEGTQYVDTVVVKIGDFEAPAYTGNALPLTHGTGSTQEQLTLVDRDSLLDLYDQGLITTISTDPFECTANFATNLDIMEATFGFEVLDCEVADYSLSIWNYGPRINHEFPLGDTMWRETNYPIINGAAVGIPVGVYALVLEVNDGCYNHSKGVTFFKVQDQIAPTMSCDDDLNVTLSTAGYAKVYAEDIDEGTNDNCLLGELQVRRSVSEDCMASGFFDIGELVLEDGVYYTAWSDYVEFCCCDLSLDPTVELRAMDQARDPLLQETAPNQNLCWMQLTLEDKLEPNCTDLAPVTTFCDDPELGDLTSFGTPDVPFSNCDNIQAIELEAITDLDRCGFGTITRQFQAVKNLDTSNEERSDICTQVIEVVARHDYWLQFPADQTANCGDDLDIRGVEFTENACDLIAISHTDEEFLATQDPDACYKIFRTYRVINWCEYDGEAQPTIISRDWDSWNDENPVSPDGDDNPGDEDIFVIVKRNFADGEPDTVYYDNNANPYDDSVVDGNDTYGYWWNVVSGNNDPSTEYYYEGAPVSGDGPAACRSCFSTWSFDGDQEDSDISGNVQGDDNDYRYGSFGYWQYTQHIVVYDDVDPQLTVTTEDTFCSISNEDCAGPVEFTFTASDLCTDDTDDVFVTVELDVNNDGTINTDVTGQVDGNTFSGRYPIGTHRLVFTANDGCGNTVQEERIFTVADCKAPAPIVIDAISVELTRTDEDTTGASAIAWVSDFIASPVFDCSGQGPDGEILRYSINRVGETPDSSVTSIYVNCTEAAQTLEVEIHAWDEAGNHDFVRTFLLVQDNMGACDQAAGEGQISGSVATENGEMVNEVEVSLSGQGSATYVTNATGTFSFTGLEEDFDFSVIPRKNIYHSNGISTFDLVLMQKDILGIQPLTSPYKRIAADVNNSRSITTLDLIQLRKIILNVDVAFSSNTSWRFVDAEFDFPNPESPWESGFPEVKNINNLEGEEVADFVAIKVGDVNGSAMAYVQPRSNRDWTIQLDGPQKLRAGEEAILTFSSSELATVSGYQFTLQWNTNQLEVIDLLPGHARDEHFGWFSDQGIITTSWTNPGRLEDHASLFKLSVRAKQDMSLSDAIALSSRYTAAEAYDILSGELMEIELRTAGQAFAKKETTLYQNRPNPFTGETVIGFELAVAGTATIQIKDLTGRLVREIKGDYEVGHQEVRLKSDELPAKGVFTYTLRAGETTITRKMVVLE